MLVMKEIALTKGLTAKVDDEDYDAVLAAGPWHAVKPNSKSGGYYAQRRVKVAEGGPRRLQYMHSFLTGYRRTDHRNCDGLDNRRGNLRETTMTQNGANARPRRGGSSEYKGVSWDTTQGKWRAQLSTKGRCHYLGSFLDERAAAAAYNRAAVDHFGEYARINDLEKT
jgi:hypothetical protein